VLPFGEAHSQSASSDYPFPERRQFYDRDENGNGYQDISFTVVWRGRFRVDQSDTYRFVVRHDDYVWITVNGTQVMATPGCCAGAEESSPFPLTQGQWATIEIRFDNRWYADDFLEIRLRGDTVGTVVIPQQNLGCP
jgi:hypothetical protein